MAQIGVTAQIEAKEKRWAQPLEKKLFCALENMNAAFVLMHDAAGEKAKFTLSDAEKINKAKAAFYEACVAFSNECNR
jgi:hypothetical protein